MDILLWVLYEPRAGGEVPILGVYDNKQFSIKTLLPNKQTHRPPQDEWGQIEGGQVDWRFSIVNACTSRENNRTLGRPKVN